MATRGKFTITEKDHGWEKLKRTLKAIRDGDSYAKIGVLDNGATDPEDGFTMASLAAVHEFGSPESGIPERSFIRAGFDAQRSELVALMQKLVLGIYEGRFTVEQALGIAGLKTATGIRNFVTRGPQIPPPNAPATIAAKLRKGTWKLRETARKTKSKNYAKIAARAAAKVRTLVDTGRLINAVTYVVVISSQVRRELRDADRTADVSHRTERVTRMERGGKEANRGAIANAAQAVFGKAIKFDRLGRAHDKLGRFVKGLRR